MKTYAVLACLVMLNLNCQEMNNKECFDTKNFNVLATKISESNTTIELHERLVADKELIAKELSFDDKYLELINENEIIVIDKNNETPTYSCTIADNQLKFSAYESRFDTEQDIANRRNDWCEIIKSLVIEN